jgi:hypothetical protein
MTVGQGFRWRLAPSAIESALVRPAVLLGILDSIGGQVSRTGDGIVGGSFIQERMNARGLSEMLGEHWRDGGGGSPVDATCHGSSSQRTRRAWRASRSESEPDRGPPLTLVVDD